MRSSRLVRLLWGVAGQSLGRAWRPRTLLTSPERSGTRSQISLSRARQWRSRARHATAQGLPLRGRRCRDERDGRLYSDRLAVSGNGPATITVTASAPGYVVDGGSSGSTTCTQNGNCTPTRTINLTLTPSTPVSDLTITKTDGQTTDMPGTRDHLHHRGHQRRPSAATDVVVADTFPATLTGVTWTSVGSAGVIGNDASGSGNINDTVTFIPVGGTVTYTVNATIAPAATGTLVQHGHRHRAGRRHRRRPATTAPPTPTRPDVQYDLSITKTDGQPPTCPGTSITYTIVVTNAGPSAATNVGRRPTPSRPPSPASPGPASARPASPATTPAAAATSTTPSASSRSAARSPTPSPPPSTRPPPAPWPTRPPSRPRADRHRRRPTTAPPTPTRLTSSPT